MKILKHFIVVLMCSSAWLVAVSEWDAWTAQASAKFNEPMEPAVMEKVSPVTRESQLVEISKALVKLEAINNEIRRIKGGSSRVPSNQVGAMVEKLKGQRIQIYNATIDHCPYLREDIKLQQTLYEDSHN